MAFNRNLRWGRVIWSLFVTWYLINFSYNFFTSTIPERSEIPIAFFIVLVVWMVLEYYFESPYFQSGLVSYSGLIKSSVSFFFYINGIYAVADFAFLHWTQIPVWYPFINIIGLFLFSWGVFIRLKTLFELLLLKNKLYFNCRSFQYCRHPRLLGTFIQILAIPIVFSSYLAIILSVSIGFLLIYQEVQIEEKLLLKEYKDVYKNYQTHTPLFLPRITRK
ncbi:MAG: hypothetical protein RMJ65_07200 [candidate division WOR-3 bacterium]|nr:hypothetical protein [candidate division WOR-3 bacterium]